MPPGGLGKIALRAMPVRLASSSNGLGVAALWVEFPPDPLRVAAQCFMPKPFAFSAQTLCRRSERVSRAPFSCRGTARGRPLFFFTRNRETSVREQSAAAPVVFHAKPGNFAKRQSAAAPQPFPRPLQPSAFLQNVKDARIKPVALVGGEGLKTDFEVAGINRGAVHGFNFIDGEFPLVP